MKLAMTTDPDTTSGIALHKTQAPANAASLLPVELLLSVLALTHPSAHLAATCRLIATAFRSDDPILKRSWHHHIIFYDSPGVAAATDHEYALAQWGGFGTQPLQSRLSFFLKSRLPSMRMPHSIRCRMSGPVVPADDLAPDTPLHDTFINEVLISYLFTNRGPFACHPPLTSSQIQHYLQSLWDAQHTTGQDGVGDDTSDGHPMLKFLSHGQWQLLPDAIQLATFCIRSGNPDLLYTTLSHLHKKLPSLATVPAPIAHWATFALDNRDDILDALMLLSRGPNQFVSFPIFLILLCALDWSFSCITVVLQVHQVSESDITAFLRRRSILGYMLDVLDSISCAERILSMLDWLKHHGVVTNVAFPISVKADRWPVFVKLFRRFDQDLLDTIEELDRGSDLGLAIVKMAFNSRSAGADADGFTWRDMNEVVRIGFEKQLIDFEAKGKLYAKALAFPNDEQAIEWQECVDRFTHRDEQGEWMLVLDCAISHAIGRASTRSRRTATAHVPNHSVVTQLLNKLASDHHISPVQYFARSGEQLSWPLVQTLIDCSPPEAFDLIAYASHLVQWILLSGLSIPVCTFKGHAEILIRLLDMAVNRDAAKTQAQLAQMSTEQVAVMLVAGAGHVANGARSDATQDQVDLRAPLPATRSMLLNLWRARQKDGLPLNSTSRASFLPPHLCNWVHVMVLNAVKEGWTSSHGLGHAKPTALVQRINQGDTCLGQALALLIALDPELVTKYMIWNKGTPLWLWHMFDPALVSAKMHEPTVGIACFKHAARVGCVDDVLAVIRRVPEAWWTQSYEWLRALRAFVEVESRLSLRERIAAERPGWWRALDAMTETRRS